MLAASRYHFLDGLRGVAMILGVVLHTAMAYRGWQVWGVDEVSAAPAVFGWLFDFIHGFRMQLFFVVSGFFTMMLAKRRGFWKLLKQRMSRIGIPLVVGTLILSPLIFVIGMWGEMRAEAHNVVFGSSSRVFLEAAAVGDAEQVAESIKGEVDLEVRGDGAATALISAAFFGRAECVELLLEAGADIEAKDRWGTTPLKAATMDYKVVQEIGEAVGLIGDREGRKACANLLKDAGATGAVEEVSDQVRNEAEEHSVLDQPLFHHLWFLYYLGWLLAAFSLLAKLPWRLPDALVVSPLALIWVVPVAWCFQMMMPWQMGPATATEVRPSWPKLGYYAVFFFFGVLCYGRGFLAERLGRFWPLWLVLAVPCLWVAREWQWWAEMQVWAQLAAVCYAWLMIAVSFGVFRSFLNSGSERFRYLSDASYWLYLAHLPPIMVVQILIGSWEVSAWIKFPLTVVVVTVPLLVIYEYAVRYTWIGTLLNGRKTRVDIPVRGDR